MPDPLGFCPGCGRAVVECDGCSPAFDPPRFCVTCAKRLAVRVSPGGWRARCNRCGSDLVS